MITNAYDATYRRSLEHPDEFWAEAASELVWYRRWEKVLDGSRAPFYRWFEGGMVNTCFNAVDRHVERGQGNRTAILYDSPVTDTVRAISYRELRDATARLAGALAASGATKGDRVVIYMPMVP